MSDPTANAESVETSPGPSRQYVVIARRYRPQTFDDLLGQEHVAQALSNAIATNRVGHAYLFTGARGVGKTSAARILAKALNCEHGPAPVPCNECDICRSISGGDDVDVLEIDGASNRGIDEIRQLRQNVNVRPSRARFKIYIIDEVHMLTREAFNALLKTLEEPPQHVKFIFCTTEPAKIPITILSRCQRFDFAGIESASIVRRLRQIVAAEGVEAEPAALEVLARRAAGSMRDSQSLLEQLLAFSSGRITVADVHGMLGTAGDERMAELVGHLAERNAAAALAQLDAAMGEGVEPSLLLEQLLGYFRDCMVAAVGCPDESLLYVSPTGRQAVSQSAKRLGLASILAVVQILDQTLSRLRFSTQGRTLAELALVRICQLEELDELGALISQLQSGHSAVPTGQAQSTLRPGSPAAASAGVAPTSPASRGIAAPPVSPPLRLPAGESTGKKKYEPSVAADVEYTSTASDAALAAPPIVQLTPENAVEVWSTAIAKLPGLIAEQAKLFDKATLAAPNRLVIAFKPSYAFAKATCERPEQASRFEQALAEVTGQPIRLEFRLLPAEAGAAEAAGEAPRPVSPQQRFMEIVRHPLIRRAGELFGAQPQPLRADDRPNRE